NQNERSYKKPKLLRARDYDPEPLRAHALGAREADLAADHDRLGEARLEKFQIASVAGADVQHRARRGAEELVEPLHDEFGQRVVDRERLGVVLEELPQRRVPRRLLDEAHLGLEELVYVV